MQKRKGIRIASRCHRAEVRPERKILGTIREWVSPRPSGECHAIPSRSDDYKNAIVLLIQCLAVILGPSGDLRLEILCVFYQRSELVNQFVDINSLDILAECLQPCHRH